MATKTMDRSASLATLTVVCGLFLIDIANLGMANIALPTLQKSLGFNSGSLQWVLTAYSLTFAGFLMVGGRLGDIFGQKYVVLFGTSLFNIATLGCALADSDVGLVVGRAFQGLAAAFTIPPSQSLLALAFEDETARTKAFGVWGACGSSGFVLGPILGGIFTSLLSWRWIFWFCLIVEGALEIAAFALLFTHRLPDPPARDPMNGLRGLLIRLDVLGTLCSVAGLMLLVFALSEGNVQGWSSVEVIVTLVLAVVLLAAFVFVELKVASNPILPRYLWGDRIRVLGCIAAALVYGVWQGSNYLLTLQLQSLGFSALSTAIRFLPLGITAIAVNVVLPTLFRLVSTRKLLVPGWTLALVGVLLLSFIADRGEYWRFCLPGMILYIAGLGTVNFVANITVVATARKDLQGTISGIFNMSLNVGGAVLGVALLTAITNAVTDSEGGDGDPRARLQGFRAGYYSVIAMTGVGFIVGCFYKKKDSEPKQDEESEPQELRETHAKDEPNEPVATP